MNRAEPPPTGDVPREPPESPEAAAIVLAGGASRRMGRPKAFLTVGGRELLEHALEVATGACRSVVLVCAERDACAEALARYGWVRRGSEGRVYSRRSARLEVLADTRPGQGPLAGLETAWKAARAAGDGTEGAWTASPVRWWALAVDLPFVTAGLGRRLLEELRSWEDRLEDAPPAATGRAVVPVVAARRQPLCAAYSATAGAVATRCLDEGTRAMEAFLDRLALRLVELEPPLAGQLDNVNTPEDLARANRRAAPER